MEKIHWQPLVLIGLVRTANPTLGSGGKMNVGCAVRTISNFTMARYIANDTNVGIFHSL